MKDHGSNYMLAKSRCQSIARLGFVAVLFRLNFTTFQPNLEKLKNPSTGATDGTLKTHVRNQQCDTLCLQLSRNRAA